MLLIARHRHGCPDDTAPKAVALERLTSPSGLQQRHLSAIVQAYLKHAAVTFLRPQREFRTMAQLLHELAKQQPPRSKTRKPVFLFLGGGMAAGAFRCFALPVVIPRAALFKPVARLRLQMPALAHSRTHRTLYPASKSVSQCLC